MKQLLDFIPLVIFFVLFKMYDIYVGVSALMIASTVSLIISAILLKKIEKINLFTYLMIIIFGAMTLYFHNPCFIKWKVTILYILFASILAISQFIFKKPILQKLLNKEIELNDLVWTRINLAWILFFVLCAIANLYVTYFMSEEFWATFKVFILPAITLLFTLMTGIYIYKNMDKTKINNN